MGYHVCPIVKFYACRVFRIALSGKIIDLLESLIKKLNLSM